MALCVCPLPRRAERTFPSRPLASSARRVGAGVVLIATLILATFVPCAGRAAGTDLPAPSRAFVATNCLDCHTGEDADGGLDLTALGTDLRDEALFARWVRIFDRVNDGEMPPADYGVLDAEEIRPFVEHTGDWLRQAQRLEHAGKGRVQGRRLTNHQLERTLQDLLSIDIPLASQMPEEPRHAGFEHLADYQSISHFHLEDHLGVVDTALDEAFRRVVAGDESWKRHYTAKDIARKNPKKRNRDPEMRNGKAVVWNSGLIFYGRISSTRAGESGWYRVTLKASAVKKPKGHGVWCSVRSGPCVAAAPLLSWVGSFEARDEPQQWTFETWMSKGDMLEIRPADRTLKRARFRSGQVGVGEGEPQDVPGVAMHEMTIQRIHRGGSAEDVVQSLFGQLPMKVDRKSGKKSGKIRFAGDAGDPKTRQALVRQLAFFAQWAFRRPVRKQHLEPYVSLLESKLDEGQDPIDALRASYRAVLCSPRFLYFIEPVGKLDDWAIASRLSYFLGNSMPDRELFALARKGKLRDPNVLHAQVERLLQTRRGKDFVRDFAGQWLDLVDIDATEPDRKLYRNFDIIVQHAMLSETRAYLQYLLDQDESVDQLIDSKYTFLNSRLARYYGIDGIRGDAVRRVELPADSHRGGLLAQGAILKVTANGNDTSPVLRGVWVSERLLGKPIPPPPAGIPAVEPDIRGATTIRELLEKHKSDPSCAGCHVNIDPPGYALENFDAAGRWRNRYIQVKRGRPRPAAKVDASYTLPDGRPFNGFNEFRRLIARDEKTVAKNVAEKLLVYATGAPISFADRPVIDRIVDETAGRNDGFRSLLHAVVASPTFLTK